MCLRARIYLPRLVARSALLARGRMIFTVHIDQVHENSRACDDCGAQRQSMDYSDDHHFDSAHSIFEDGGSISCHWF
jgi:hypothetical protein